MQQRCGLNGTQRSSEDKLKLSNNIGLKMESDSLPKALQKHGPLSNSIASSLKTSSKLQKLQMEIEPGPFMSQSEVLPAAVLREARPTPIKSIFPCLTLLDHTCTAVQSPQAVPQHIWCMYQERWWCATKSLISTRNSWGTNMESHTRHVNMP